MSTFATPAKRKRTREVFPTREIAHLWAHQTQASARNPQGNFFFQNRTIYSYGGHFPIACIVDIGKSKRKAVFFSTRSASITTAGHCSHVRHSIPPSMPVILVPDPASMRPADVLVYFKKEVREAIDSFYRVSAAKGSRLATRRNAFRAYASVRAQAVRFSEAFGFSTRYATAKDDAAHESAFDQYDTILRDRREKRKAEQAERERLEDIADRATALEQFAEWQEGKREEIKIGSWYLPCELRAEYNAAFQKRKEEKRLAEIAERIDQWRQDVSYASLPPNTPTLLRLRGETLETSHGANFPLAAAVQALPFIESALASGRSFKPNGRVINLGHYSIDAITSDGTIVAGCHRVPKEETLRLIAELRTAGKIA